MYGIKCIMNLVLNGKQQQQQSEMLIIALCLHFRNNTFGIVDPWVGPVGIG